MAEIAEANPFRIGLFLQNRDLSIKIGIYIRKEEPYGGIILDPLCWVQLEKDDNPEAQWFARAVTGSGYLNTTEFYKIEKKDPYKDWP